MGVLEQTTVVYIPKGTGSSAVASILTEAGVIDKPLFFRIYGRLKGLDTKVKAGEYEFSPHISVVDVFQKMVSNDVYYRKITLPEGLTTKQFIDIINNEPMLEGEISLEVSEGELLPETYSFERGSSRNTLITIARQAMENALNVAWATKEGGLPIKNPRELLILASIIEKETGLPNERGLVASVFVNRLKKGMMLQTDPTVIYAITKGQKDLGRSLLRKDLQIDSPYNTYKYYGLPPAPICNPGLASIKAASNPEVSPYLYFVASGNGGHNFSKTLDEHNRNVRNYRAKN